MNPPPKKVIMVTPKAIKNKALEISHLFIYADMDCVKFYLSVIILTIS